MARGITPSVPGLTLGASAHDPDHRHRRTPEQVESLLIKPVLAAFVALNPLCSRVLRPTAPSVRLPAVTADPTAAWVAEGAEIPVSDLQTAEVDVVTRKVAGAPAARHRCTCRPGGHLCGSLTSVPLDMPTVLTSAGVSAVVAVYTAGTPVVTPDQDDVGHW